jgi:hypothetical protein
MIGTIEPQCGGAYVTDVPEDVVERFDRIPYGFGHTLAGLELFDFEALCALAREYDHDYYIAGGATAPDERFYAVRPVVHSPYDALRRIDVESQRVLLKRPEQYDARYRDLKHAIFDEILRWCGGLGDERVVRLSSSILISSSATTTPFHFDPEVTFFFQIGGEKSYHLYVPTVLSEIELESFYRMGILNIGQVDLEGRDPAREFVFELTPGKGFHQPQNSPHWVRTHGSRSISYAISFETDASRRIGRTRAFNYYLRKLGMQPALPGAHPERDAAKAVAMQAAIPLRKNVGKVVRKLSAITGKT